MSRKKSNPQKQARAERARRAQRQRHASQSPAASGQGESHDSDDFDSDDFDCPELDRFARHWAVTDAKVKIGWFAYYGIKGICLSDGDALVIGTNPPPPPPRRLRRLREGLADFRLPMLPEFESWQMIERVGPGAR